MTFEETLKQHEKLLQKLSHRLQGKHLQSESFEDINSLMQYVAWKSYEAREKHKLETGEYKFSFGAYLWGNLQNALRGPYKDLSFAKESFQTENYSIPKDDRVETDFDTREALNVAIAKLKPQEAQLINMKYFENLSLTECSGIMNIPITTLARMEKVALNKLKDHTERDFK